MLERWAKENLYAKIRKKSEGKKTFILHDGPPYANGNIHIGHALNKILKDMIVKCKTMQGMDSLYVPGWDCHGLPIEHQLLKELKKHKSQVESVDFRKKAYEYAMKYVGIQKEEFKRLGVLGEWENPYLTLTPEYEYWILKSLATLHKKGYVYRGLKPVNWCATCETALAEAEVEYEEHTSPSVYVKFEVDNPEVISGLPKGKKAYLLIWTTTPWTLLANVAVAINPKFIYVLVGNDREVLIIEKSLSVSVLTKTGEKYKVLCEVEGGLLENFRYKHPFAIRENCLVVKADYVSREDGTGLVHTAPGHGHDDFETGLKYKLDILMPVDDRGIYTKEAGRYAGEHVFKANEKIVADLKEKGMLFAQENIVHSYPHCWRCKKPIIFRATKQWFLKIDHENLRGRLVEAIKHNVEWIPPAGEERILSMVISRPDWCLSRQRFWGVPIPALECKGCGERILLTEVIEHFADIARKEGTSVWFERDVHEFVRFRTNCPQCGKAEFEKTFDILDVWFDSGVSHQAVVKAMLKKDIPIEMYLEGSDQHRGWFQSSLIPAMAIEGKPPFKSVLTHGFVVDGQGRKMSKSLGNVISPQDVMKENGADMLRLWVASSSYNEDVRISKEILERLIDAYRKIRNTFRYILGNVYDFDPSKDLVPYKDLLGLDRWMLYRLSEVIRGIEKNYYEYEFAKVYKSIYNFCNEDLSGFYLDILKDRLYTSASYSTERRSAQTVLYHSANFLVRLLAPILSFTADEIFTSIPKDKETENTNSVHLLEWLKVPQEWDNTQLQDSWLWLMDFRPYVLKALEEMRKSEEIGSSLEAKVIIQTESERDWQHLQKFKDILNAVFIVSQSEIQRSDIVSEGISDNFLKTKISVKKADGYKCQRCWNYKVEVGEDPEHPTLCFRCTTIVKELAHAG